MPNISIECVIGLAPDERGQPQALLVLGTTTERTAFSVAVSTPADAKLQPARLDIEKARIPANLEIAEKSIRWEARFEFTAHPPLQHLRFGLQDERLEITAVVVGQTGRDEVVARAPIFHIGRSGYGCAVGLLFVHGIGSHQRGQTLVACGEPIVCFLRDWLDGVKEKQILSWSEAERKDWIKKTEAALSPRSSLQELAALKSIEDVQRDGAAAANARREIEILEPRIVIGDMAVHEAALASRSDRSDEPAHAEVSLRSIGLDGEMRAAQLVLAESCWTNAILAPSFRDLFDWGFIVVPMMLGLHAAEPCRRAAISVGKETGFGGRTAALAKTIAAFVYLLAIIAVAIPVEILLTALFVVGLVPIPQLRDVVVRMQQSLVGSVGQSYVLVAGPMRLAAMATRVNQDLRWLCQRCRTVVIVAHSQGAAIVHYALRQEVLPQIQALFTLGSGIKQLEILRQEHRRASMLIKAWATLAGPALALYWILAHYVFIPTFGGHYPKFILDEYFETKKPLIFGLLIWISGALYLAMSATTAGAAWKQLDYWIEVIKRFKIRWTDFYASRDPVPNGPLDNKNIDSVEVHNFGSLAADHVTYWRNTEEVVARIAFDVAERAGLPIRDLTRHDQWHVWVAERRRPNRVRVLEAARWTAIVSAAFVLLGYLSGSGIANLWPLLSGKAGDVHAWLPAAPLLAPLAAILGCYALTLVAWNHWTADEIAALKARSADLKFGGWPLVFFALWSYQGLLLLIYAISNLQLLTETFVMKACGRLSPIVELIFGQAATELRIHAQWPPEVYCGWVVGVIGAIVCLFMMGGFVLIWFLVVRSWPTVRR